MKQLLQARLLPYVVLMWVFISGTTSKCDATSDLTSEVKTSEISAKNPDVCCDTD